MAETRPRVVSLFVTCLVDQFFPEVGESVVKTLRHLEVDVDFPQGQTCCGQPALNRLAKMAELQGWKLSKVGPRAKLAAAVVELAKSLGARCVVRPSHPILEETNVDGALSAEGIQVTPLTSDPADVENSRDRIREAEAEADMGITGVDYIVSEAATAALVSRRGNSSLVSLLPPVHVAVVEPEQVVETMGDLLALRQAELLESGGAPWYMNLISGPSRTADIGQTIVIGVHGTREVYLMIVVEDGIEG